MFSLLHVDRQTLQHHLERRTLVGIYLAHQRIPYWDPGLYTVYHHWQILKSHEPEEGKYLLLTMQTYNYCNIYYTCIHIVH